MKVETAEEQQFDWQAVFRYLLGTVFLTGLIYAPAIWYPSYLRGLTSILLVVLVGLTGRAVVSAIFSFADPETPELVPTERLPSVSVVIPAYNEAAVLPETISACKAVEYPAEKLEVILCYEADSVDATAELCEDAAADDDRFVAVERDEPGGGKAKATNYALEYATGDIIASIDADHQFKPDAIKKAVAWFHDDEDVWCVKGRCFGHNPRDSLFALHATVERHIAERADLFARDVWDGFTIFGGGQAFFRAAVFDELGAFDEEILVEDIDMSAKIHEHGKQLRVDPSIITYEENPSTLQSWWSQRKRWARGWMQCAEKYLVRLPSNRSLSLSTRIDSLFTFAYALAPVYVAFTFPLLLLGYVGVDTSTYIPYSKTLWTLLAISPALAAFTVYLQDYRSGETHDIVEYIAPFTLWVYLAFQSAVYIVSFFDEYVFDRPSIYVTTARVDSPADTNSTSRDAPETHSD
jgi:cellulose synthase/poly-beta-1,6-N-acetylglucosamine synthase-like glycosyltransferase